MARDARCPRCGGLLTGAGSVDDLCSGCLLSLGLQGPGEAPDDSSPARPRGTLHPVGTGATAPTWAMPAELLRQSSRRLVIASFGVALAFSVGIILNNLIEVMAWHQFSNLAVKNLAAGAVVGVSAVVAWTARRGGLTPRDLLRVSLAYEVFVGLGISLSDHAEPMVPGVPLAAVSWLCVWIVLFPLVVPAPPGRALLAGLAAASTWPLAYFLGLAVGNPPAPPDVVAINFLEVYLAVGLAMFATTVMRRLQEMGCYRLVKKLDHGGMGEIWRARHQMLTRPVAIKLIRPELLGVRSPQEAAHLVARFRREAEATAGLHSPHTVALYDFGVTPEGVFYYVMELLEGLDLETLVRRFGPVPPERAVHLLTQACESLADAHAAGLIHRDVKPANVVACHWGLKWDFVKVLDFGLVKAKRSLGEDDRLTTEGMVAGTPAYMAPETVLGGRPLDPRADLYGLGCVAYWLLTGEQVFTGATPMEVLLHHVKTPVPPPSERVTWALPADLEKLVLSCLAKEPEKRPPSAEWLGEHLAECCTERRWTPQRARQWWENNVLGPGAPVTAWDPPAGTTETPVAPPVT